MIARKRHTHRLSSKKIVALHTTNTYGSSSYIYYVVLVWYSIDARRAFTFFVYILQCFFCTLTCTHSKCTHDNINRGPVYTIFLSTGPMIWICCVCVAKKSACLFFCLHFRCIRVPLFYSKLTAHCVRTYCIQPSNNNFSVSYGAI